MSTGPTRYYLYIPVWATGTPPQGGGSSELSESSGSQSGTGGGPGQTDPPSSVASSMPMSGTEGPPSTELPSGFTNESSGGATTGSGSVPPSGTAGGSSGGGFSGSGGTGPGGTEPGGTGPGGTTPGGTGPGGSGPGGSSGNCLLVGTLVRLADGRLLPIEHLRPGDAVASLRLPGLAVDVPYRAQYEWLAHHELTGAEPVPARVASITLGEHHGFVVINRRIKATAEHPILIRRGEELGFASAELVVPGDRLIDESLNEETVETIDRINAPSRTVAIHIPGTNTLLAEGVWVHNDRPTGTTSGSGSDGSSKTSSSSSFSSSGSSGSSSSSAPGFSASMSESTGPVAPESSGSFVSFGE